MKLTKIIANLLLASSLITLMPLEAQAETVSKQSGKVIENTKSDKKGEWISVKNSYTYNRWYRIGDSWATGWQKIDGNWYYFNSDGSPAVATPERGSSWKQIDGKWYSFGANGIMKSNSIIVDYPDEYYVGADGALTQMPTSGWVKKQNALFDNWRYRIDNAWAKGWQLIDGKWYYFYVSGDMMTNCTKDGYRAGEDGVCVPV